MTSQAFSIRTGRAPRRHPAAAATRFLAALLVACVAPAIAGCAADGREAELATVAGTSWGTHETLGFPFIAFAGDGSFSGTDGCNRLQGDWRMGRQAVIFSDVTVTRASCGTLDIWLSALGSATVTDDTITFSDSNGTILGSLRSAPSAKEPTEHEKSPLANTMWGTPNEFGSPSAVLYGDGRVGLYDGCNSAGGTWREDGDTVLFEDMHVTLIYCEGVDGWLTSAETAVVAGTTMTFIDREGRELGSLEQTEFVDRRDTVP